MRWVDNQWRDHECMWSWNGPFKVYHHVEVPTDLLWCQWEVSVTSTKESALPCSCWDGAQSHLPPTWYSPSYRVSWTGLSAKETTISLTGLHTVNTNFVSCQNVFCSHYSLCLCVARRFCDLLQTEALWNWFNNSVLTEWVDCLKPIYIVKEFFIKIFDVHPVVCWQHTYIHIYSQGERQKNERLTLLACRNEKFGTYKGGNRELQIR
jgi:hypothetical protein